MIVALCVDDNNGISFFGKRQSRDREVIKDFMTLSGGKAIIAPCSTILFRQYENVTADKDFLETAGRGDYCFSENRNISEYSDRIKKIILYKWNRSYPSDKMFIMPDGFELADSTDFKGYSHEKITREIYCRKESDNEKA